MRRNKKYIHRELRCGYGDFFWGMLDKWKEKTCTGGKNVVPKVCLCPNTDISSYKISTKNVNSLLSLLRDIKKTKNKVYTPLRYQRK